MRQPASADDLHRERYLPLGSARQDQYCRAHPIISSDLLPGDGARAEDRLSYLKLERERFHHKDILRLVLATMTSHEPSQAIDVTTKITKSACEKMGDLLEAVGGILAPYNQSAIQLRKMLQSKHAFAPGDAADAMRGLTGLVKNVKELVHLVPDRSVPHDAPPEQIIRPVLAYVWKAITSKVKITQTTACRICRWYARHDVSRFLYSVDRLEAAAQSIRDARRADSDEETLSTRAGGSDRPEDDEDADMDGDPDALMRAEDEKFAWRENQPIVLLPNPLFVEADDEPRDQTLVSRKPDDISDTRFRAQRHLAEFKCDHCLQPLQGRRQGNFVPGVRDLDLWRIEEGWMEGLLDASWYCTMCWKDYHRFDDIRTTENWIGLMRKKHMRLPVRVTDHRFHRKKTRWFRCDYCKEYQPGRHRYYLYGSFVYHVNPAINNGFAGPGAERANCFPRDTYRRWMWANLRWQAHWACRECLPSVWRVDKADVDDWLWLWPPGWKKQKRERGW